MELGGISALKESRQLGKRIHDCSLCGQEHAVPATGRGKISKAPLWIATPGIREIGRLNSVKGFICLTSNVFSNENRHGIHTKGPEGPLCLQMVFHLSKAVES